MTTAEMIQKIRDPNNWSDDFFQEIEELFSQHFNAVRNTLVKEGLWDRFDRGILRMGTSRTGSSHERR